MPNLTLEEFLALKNITYDQLATVPYEDCLKEAHYSPEVFAEKLHLEHPFPEQPYFVFTELLLRNEMELAHRVRQVAKVNGASLLYFGNLTLLLQGPSEAAANIGNNAAGLSNEAWHLLRDEVISVVDNPLQLIELRGNKVGFIDGDDVIHAFPNELYFFRELLSLEYLPLLRKLWQPNQPLAHHISAVCIMQNGTVAVTYKPCASLHGVPRQGIYRYDPNGVEIAAPRANGVCSIVSSLCLLTSGKYAASYINTDDLHIFDVNDGQYMQSLLTKNCSSSARLCSLPGGGLVAAFAYNSQKHSCLAVYRPDEAGALDLSNLYFLGQAVAVMKALDSNTIAVAGSSSSDSILVVDIAGEQTQPTVALPQPIGFHPLQKSVFNSSLRRFEKYNEIRRQLLVLTWLGYVDVPKKYGEKVGLVMDVLRLILEYSIDPKDTRAGVQPVIGQVISAENQALEAGLFGRVFAAIDHQASKADLGMKALSLYPAAETVVGCNSRI